MRCEGWWGRLKGSELRGAEASQDVIAHPSCIHGGTRGKWTAAGPRSEGGSQGQTWPLKRARARLGRLVRQAAVPLLGCAEPQRHLCLPYALSHRNHFTAIALRVRPGILKAARWDLTLDGAPVLHGVVRGRPFPRRLEPTRGLGLSYSLLLTHLSDSPAAGGDVSTLTVTFWPTRQWKPCAEHPK